MDSKAIRDWIFIILIFLIGLSMILLLKGQSNKCTSDPFKYSAEVIKKNNNADLFCSCSVLTNPPSHFEFGTNGIVIKENEINFSVLNITTK